MPEEDGVVDLCLTEPRLLIPGGEDLHGHALAVPHASPHLAVASFACGGHGTVSRSPSGPQPPPHTRGDEPAAGVGQQWGGAGPVEHGQPPPTPPSRSLPPLAAGRGRAERLYGFWLKQLSSAPCPGSGTISCCGKGLWPVPEHRRGVGAAPNCARPLSLPTHSTRVICRATVLWTRKGSPEPLPVVQSSFSRSCTARVTMESAQRPPHPQLVLLSHTFGAFRVPPRAHPPPKCCLPSWMSSA